MRCISCIWVREEAEVNKICGTSTAYVHEGKEASPRSAGDAIPAVSVGLES